MEPCASGVGSKTCAPAACAKRLDRLGAGIHSKGAASRTLWSTPMTATTAFECKTLSAALLAGTLAFAGTALAQYPEDPSRMTIALPPPGAITPPLANDPIGARIDRTAGTDTGKAVMDSDSKQSIVREAMSD